MFIVGLMKMAKPHTAVVDYWGRRGRDVGTHGKEILEWKAELG